MFQLIKQLHIPLDYENQTHTVMHTQTGAHTPLNIEKVNKGTVLIIQSTARFSRSVETERERKKTPHNWSNGFCFGIPWMA